MITGATTAMKRATLSEPARWLKNNVRLRGEVLDYGCGRGGDADLLGCDRFDPYWHPEIDPLKVYDTILCTYVLNVVDEATQADILADIQHRLAPGGIAYISVRRDLPREGRAGRGCHQRYVELPLPCLRLCASHAIYAFPGYL